MIMAALQIQEGSGKGVPEVIVTSKSGAAPASAQDEPVLVRGNLQKLGKRFKGWHQRYFEIQGSHMYYYKNASKKECLGEINLTICFSCEPTKAATFGSPFEIKTVQRSHVLAARSKDEMQQWIKVIKERMSPSESEAKKGSGKKDTAKKATKPKRWESFKGAFAIKQRSQSPAQLDTQDQKKNVKKSFIDRFKVKRTQSHRHSQDLQKTARRSSFTGTDEKSKDTLDVFRQFEVSKSLPSSPVSRRRKKNSLPSRGSPETYSGVSRSSGSPFTGGATTEDSQHSTPLHVAATASGQDQDARTQQEVASGSVVGQEIQIRVDVEDASRAPTAAEATQEAVEASGTAATNTEVDATEPVEPVQPVIAVEKESVSPGESSEPVDARQNDTESPPKPTEPAVTVSQEGSESTLEPVDPGIDVEKEHEEDKTHGEVAQGSTGIQDAPEGTTKPAEPVKQDIVEDKEPEKPALVVESAVIPEKDVEEDSKSEKPAPSTKPATVGEQDAKDAERKPDKPVLPVKAVATKENDAEKSETPTLPVKPDSINEKESERKSAEPAATHIKNESKSVSPTKRVVIAENELEEKPFIPKYLKERKFQWDKIREILETSPVSTEERSYSELPPQEDTWMEHSSPMEQLRAFLMVCP